MVLFLYALRTDYIKMTVSLVQSNKVILSSGRIHGFEVGLKEDSENYYNLRFVINNNEELIRDIFKK